MRRSLPQFAALLIAALATPSHASAQAHVRLGVDRLADSLPRVLAGKRVGLITNHTGRDRAGTPTIDLLAASTAYCKPLEAQARMRRIKYELLKGSDGDAKGPLGD